MHENRRLSRREVLGGLAAAGVGTLVGIDTVRAEPEEELWRFKTGDQVRTSPTVVDGTVFVGSMDNNVYALDAETGDEQWAFETGAFVESSPTVVDGTVFVGSLDNNVYALDVGVEASSEGSRVDLGTLGHHDGWGGGMMSAGTNGDDVDDEGTNDAGDEEAADADDGSPGFGIGGAIGGVAGVAYLLKKRLDDTKLENSI